MREIEVRLLRSDGAQVGIRECRPGKDEDLGGIAEQIARYIVEHQDAAATVTVRRDD